MKKIFLLLFIFLIVPFASADVISVNSGGSEEIVIGPDTYIEGFFGCVSTTCAKLGYTCGSWSDGCAKILDCSSCSSGYTCTSGTCVADAVTPPGPGGGDGPSGGDVCNIIVDPSEINIDLKVETNEIQIVNVTNTGSTTIEITPIQYQNLDEYTIVFNPTNFSLGPGETKKLEVRFVALNNTGNFVGRIKIGCAEVSSALNVKTLILWFDSNIVVLNRDYQVAQGNDLRTRVTLIPMGDEERLDVLLNYVIKDYQGKVFLTQSESVLVEKKMNFRKNFGTGSLPLNRYIVGLELVYPGGVAPSSAHFEIVETTATNFLGTLIFILILFILLITILIIILIIRRKRKQEQGVVQ